MENVQKSSAQIDLPGIGKPASPEKELPETSEETLIGGKHHSGTMVKVSRISLGAPEKVN